MTRSHRFSTERRRLLAALLLAGLAAVPARAVSPDEARAKARAALSDPRYQHTLPQHEEAREPGQQRYRAGQKRPLGEGDEEGAGGAVAIPVIGAGAFLGKVVFVVLLGVVALLFLGWILREAVYRRRKSVAEARPQAEIAAAAAPVLNLSFDDASKLAAEGRYAEAVHALLLAAIRHFAERSRTAIQPSRTSRELVRTLPLGPDAREAFSELVRTVELSLFGGGAVGAEDYERNLARFQALTRRPA